MIKNVGRNVLFKIVLIKYIMWYCLFIFDILEIDKLRGGYLVDYYGFFYWIVVDDFDFEVFFCVVRFYIVIYGFYEVVVVVF